MSNPPNILDRYRSHSYHHILIACSNQKVVELLSSEQGNDLTAYQDLQTFEPVFVDDNESIETPDEIAGQYFVVVNGLKDSTYTIEQVSWEAVFAGSVNATDMGNSIATMGEMTVREARGFLFLNVLNRIGDEFKSDPAGITYLLKTVFVGHTADGDSEEQRVIADLTPLRLNLVDVKGSFTPEGGEYKLDFLGMENGMSRLPMISRGAENIKFTPSSDILQNVFTQFAEKINAKSDEAYSEITSAAAERFQEEELTDVDPSFMRRVRYEIILDEAYQDPSYTVNLFDPNLRNDSNEPAALEFGRSFTVEQAIQEIMKRSQRVQDDLNKPNEEGLRYRYKIFSEVTMVDKPVGETGDAATTQNEALLVRYFVRRYLEVTSGLLDRVSPDQDDEDATVLDLASGQIQNIRNSLITFDYFFTGRNVDILKFDLNIQQAKTFLQILRTTNNSQTAVEQQVNGVPANTTAVVSGLSQKPLKELNKRSRTPVFSSTDNKDATSRNVGNPLSTTAFNAALSRFASLEQIETKFSIRGNPYLMSTTNTPISQKENDNNADQEPSERQVLVNWDKSPSLVKINIRMPLDNNSPASRRENQDPPELLPFWYDGFYYITAVRHNFSGGQFTQDITALSVISEDVFSSSLGAEGQEVANEPPTVDQNTQAEEVQQGAVTRASSGEIRTARSAVLRTKAALPPSGRRERG